MKKAVADSNVPLPTKGTVTSLGEVISPTETLRSLSPGQSFLVDNRRGRAIIVSAAYRLDIDITTAKEGARFRIWRK